MAPSGEQVLAGRRDLPLAVPVQRLRCVPELTPTAVVVDDDADIRTLMSIRLEQAGFLVWSFGDGDEGAEAVRRIRPDVGVIDWMLPGRSGLDICRQVRSDRSISDVSLVLVTARTGVADRETGLRAGVDRFVRKPFRGDELVATVWDVLLGDSLD